MVVLHTLSYHHLTPQFLHDRREQGRANTSFLPQALEGLHHRHAEAAESAHRRGRRRDPVAQDRKNPAGERRRQPQGVQKDPGAVHELRAAAEAGEDELGDAPVPPRPQRGGEGRRAGGFESLLPNAAEAVRLFEDERRDEEAELRGVL